MNIQKAKELIKESVTIYLQKDERGEYKIPVRKQRPVFLVGAPGIGKTAVAEQIAAEMGLLFVSYSMTHHTRQSAIGLPVVVHRQFEGREYDVTEYTMSEIIASVYEKMRETGKKEGIIFLDEINCVSETLGPMMLQFLQYKTFGNHVLPDGWVVITAGNPPEYNMSARDFDYVTLDRLKVIEVEADYTAWRKYASEKKIHRSICAYLDVRKEDFYSVGLDSDGKNYVTARGWEDLSDAIYLYEEQGFTVDESLIVQYLRNSVISSSFAGFYAIFNKYRDDYKIGDILSGNVSDEIRSRARASLLDERIATVELISDAVISEIGSVIENRDAIRFVLPHMRSVKEIIPTLPDADIPALIIERADAFKKETDIEIASHGLEKDERKRRNIGIDILHHAADAARDSVCFTPEERFSDAADSVNELTKKMKEDALEVKKKLSFAFDFIGECYGEDNEMLIFMTELTASPDASAFILEFGCDEFFAANKKFKLQEREGELLRKIGEIEKENI